MADGLHLVLKNTTKNFDSSFGVLKLPQAGNFTVTIKEYEDRLKKIERKKEEDLKVISEQYQKDIQFSQKKWRERATAGWSEAKLMESWDANKKARDLKHKASNAKVEADYNAKIAELNKDFATVEWVWILATRQIDPFKLNHNEIVAKGIQEFGKTLDFPKLLEGGGLAYVEAFLPATIPKGKSPFGLLVQAKGTPRILRIEWTDFNYNSLKGKKVKFGSSVLLHIYTQGLYGQDFNIFLMDKDFFSPNDELKIGKEAQFQREALIHKVLPFEKGKEGVADTLVKADQPQNDNKVEKENYLQKILIEVSVDMGWIFQAGSELLIYPSIQSKETLQYFEVRNREVLEVGLDGELYTAPRPITNNPQMVGEVETNYAAYHPCQYKEILLEYEEKDKTQKLELFKENPSVSQPSDLEVGIIVGSDPKKFSIKTDDKADTQECSFHGKTNDHAKNIFTYDKKKLPANIMITSQQPKSINGTVKFEYDNNLFKYFWLSNDFSKNSFGYPLYLMANTCRYQKKINLYALPDIEWELALSLSSEIAFQHSYTNMSSGATTKDQWKQATEAASNRRWANGDVSFELSIKALGEGFNKELQIGYVDKIKSLMSALIWIKRQLDDFCHITEAKKGTAGKIASALPGKLANSPITFQLDYPTISIKGSWKYGVVDNKSVERQGRLSFGFTPLIRGTGRLDIIKCAEYIPEAGQIISIANWVIEQINGKVWFNLFVKGEITLQGDIYFNQEKKFDLASATTVTIGVELGVAISAEVKKVNFQAGKVEKEQKAEFGGELSARGETSITINGSAGIDKYGAFLEVSGDFGGVVAFITAKSQVRNIKVGVDDLQKTIVEPIPGLIPKQTYYITGGKNNS